MCQGRARTAEGLSVDHLPSRMYTSATEPKVGRKARRLVGYSHAVKEEMLVGSAVGFLRVSAQFFFLVPWDGALTAPRNMRIGKRELFHYSHYFKSLEFTKNPTDLQNEPSLTLL